METGYIQINSVEDLDPARITIKDLNKRYIDRNGNRYATRFNLKTRKIEVIRIVKGLHEAIRIKEQARQERANPSSSRSHPDARDLEEMEELPEETGNDFEPRPAVNASPEGGIFYEHSFIEECAHDLEKMKQRLHGVLNNLKNSRLFEMADQEVLTTQVRSIESLCLTQADELGTYVKELTTYPRPISHYATRLTGEQKEKLDQAPDEQKMDLIKRFELRKMFEEYYLQIQEQFGKLLQMLEAVDQEKLSLLPAVQQQNYRDAVSSIGFILADCAEKKTRIATWKKRYP